jgi:hypothetical protein
MNVLGQIVAEEETKDHTSDKNITIQDECCASFTDEPSSSINYDTTTDNRQQTNVCNIKENKNLSEDNLLTKNNFELSVDPSRPDIFTGHQKVRNAETITGVNREETNANSVENEVYLVKNNAVLTKTTEIPSEQAHPLKMRNPVAVEYMCVSGTCSHVTRSSFHDNGSESPTDVQSSKSNVSLSSDNTGAVGLGVPYEKDMAATTGSPPSNEAVWHGLPYMVSKISRYKDEVNGTGSTSRGRTCDETRREPDVEITNSELGLPVVRASVEDAVITTNTYKPITSTDELSDEDDLEEFLIKPVT